MGKGIKQNKELVPVIEPSNEGPYLGIDVRAG